MNQFMVRVSLRPGLYSAAEAEYLDSHLITGSSGTAFQLPPGEYYIAGDFTRDEVLARAKKCAAGISRGYAVLVTQGEAFMWYGLKKAHAHVRTERECPEVRVARHRGVRI